MTPTQLIEASEAIDVLQQALETSQDVQAGVIYYDEGDKKLEPIDIAKLTEGMSQQQIIARCATDLNFFAKFMLPSVCILDFPDLMVGVWNKWVGSVAKLQRRRGEYKTSTSLPRGVAKSTLLKLFEAHVILFSKLSFIGTTCSTEKHAQTFVKDVIGLLDSPQVRTVFGHWDAEVLDNNATLRRFKFLGKDIILVPIGAVTNVRGLNISLRRVDLLVLDDAQSEENAKSVVESATLSDWVINTLIPTISAHGGMVLYVGNVYAHKGSFLDILIAMPSWLSLTLGFIDVNGEALWEALHPKQKILAAYADILEADRARGVRSGEAAWLAQYMNVKDFQRTDKVDMSRLASIYDMVSPNLREPDGSFVVLDLATGKVTSDNAVILAVKVYDGRPVCIDAEVGRFDPKTYIMKTVKMCVKHNIGDIFNESVGYQATNKFWLDKYLDELNLSDSIQSHHFEPPRTSKNSRIGMSFIELMNAAVVLAPEVQVLYRVELLKYDGTKTNNDDNLMDGVQHVSRIWEGNQELLRPRQILLNHQATMNAHERSIGGQHQEIPA